MKREEFHEYARSYNVIPVFRRLLADSETPLGVYRKLATSETGTFLLESAEHGGTWSRYSFIGVRSRATLIAHDGRAEWQGEYIAGAPRGISPLAALRESARVLRSPRIAGLPSLTGGLVGYMGYDCVRELEELPTIAPRDIDIPELAFMLVNDLAVVDHFDGTITLIANAINWDGSDLRVDEAYDDAVQRLDRMEEDLRKPALSSITEIQEFSKLVDQQESYQRKSSAEEFQRGVNVIKEEIRSGEAFQVVLSQRFETPCPTDALDVYRSLRLRNPSPYMYLFRFGHEGSAGFDIVGSSPEALVKVTGRDVMVHPIAGTRRRSSHAEEDIEIGEELLSDPKERAEHLMLVDLGRNDLGRICEPGSVDVIDFMSIERFSHVMHIVSTVTGKLASDKSAVDALYAVFPAGTLSGAPKPRAMEIIESLEPVRRGLYGGAIGYIDFTGNLDTCIAIRTALIKDGRAYVQAGAGVVADSQPESEDQECANKAAAVLTAISAAHALQPSYSHGGDVQ